jgi:hypothetical protein
MYTLLCVYCIGISRSVNHVATVKERKEFHQILQEVTKCVMLPLSPLKITRHLT